MKRLVALTTGFVFLIGCSQNHSGESKPQGVQAISLSSEEAKTSASGPLASAGGSAGQSPVTSSSSAKDSAKTPQLVAASSGRSSSDNTNRSLAWLGGTIGAMAAFVLGADAITGGQAVGLFGKKREYGQKAPESDAPSAPSSDQTTQTETVIPEQKSETSAAPKESSECVEPSANEQTLNQANQMIEFAKNPK